MQQKYDLIVFDRDGVINADSPDYIKSPDEWHALPHALHALARLYKAGYKLVIATNQSGIARKLFDEKILEKIHKKMLKEIENAGGKIEAIFICPHGPEDNCDCRKPKPGLLIKIGKHFHLAPSRILTIGDSLRDIQAAKTFGAKAVLVLTGNGKKTLEGATKSDLEGVEVYANLNELVDYLIK